MKKKMLPAAGLVLGAAVSQVSAQLLYEPFDYGTAAQNTNLDNLSGSPAFIGYANPTNGQSWFAAATTGNANDYQINAGSLNATTGLFPSSGDSAGTSNIATDKTARIGLSSSGFTTSGTTIYYSMMLQVNDVTGLNGTGTFVSGFNNSVGAQTNNPTVVGTKLMLRQDPNNTNNFQVGLLTNGANTTQWDTADSFATGTPVFIVGDYQIKANLTGTGNAVDVNDLWVNPSASTFGNGAAPSPTLTLTGGGMTTSVRSLILRGAVAGEPNGIQFDEVRADTSWAQVTAPNGAGTSGTNFIGGGSNNWSDNTQWDNNAANGANAFAYFTGSGATVNLDANQSVTDLTFKSSNAYSISSGNNSVLSMVTNPTINALAVMDPNNVSSAIAASHTISTAVSLASNLTVNTALNQTLTMSGNIDAGGGTATLTKNGPGTLVLSGTNTYNGATNINYGSLVIGSSSALSGAGNLNLSNGSSLDIGSNNVSVNVLTQTSGSTGTANTANVGNITGAGATLTANSSSATAIGIQGGTISVNLSSPGGMTKSGAGAMAVFTGTNSWAGNTTLNPNANIALFTQPASLPNYNTNANKILVGGTGSALALSVGGAGEFTTSDLDNLLTGSNATFNATARIGVNVDTGNSVTWGSLIGNSTGGNLGVVKIGGGTLKLTNAGNTYKGGLFVSGGTVIIDGNDPQTGTSELGTVPTSNLSGNNGITLSAGTLRLDSDVQILGNRRIDLGTGGGTIDTNGHTLSLGTSGASGAGPTNSGGVYGSGQTLTVTGGGTVVHAKTDLNGQSDSFSSLSVVGNSTYQFYTDTNLGAAPTAATVALTLGDATTSGTLKWRTDSAQILSNNRLIFLGAAGGTFDMNNQPNPGASQDGAVNGIQGPGNLTIKNGTFYDTGANNITWTGNVILPTGGKYRVASSGALPKTFQQAFKPGAVTFDGGTLELDNNGDNADPVLGITVSSNGGTMDIANGNTLPWNGGVTGAGNSTLVKTDAGTLQLNGDSSQNNPGANAGQFSGKWQVNQGILSAVNDNALGDSSATNVVVMNGTSASTATLTSPSATTLNHNITLSATTLGQRNGAGLGTDIFSGIISGPGTLSSVGTPTVLTNPSNSFTGGVIVSGGQLQAGANNVLAGGDLTIVAGGKTLDMNGFDQTVSTIGVTLGSMGGTILMSGNLTVNGSQPASIGFGSTLSGTGSLAMTGGGTLSMTGANSITGQIKVSNGTIQAANNSNLGDDSIPGNNTMVMDSNGTFIPTGAYAMSRNVTVNAGGGNIDNASGNDLTINGTLSGAGSLTKKSGGNLVLTGPANVLGGTLGQTGGNISVTGNTTVRNVNQTAGTLAVNGSGYLHIAPSGRATSSTSILAGAPAIDAGAQMDIEDNAVIINYASGDTTHGVRDTIRNLLKNGRNGGAGQPGAWNGLGGITSSFAHANGNGFNLAIGYGDNEDIALVRGSGSYTSFGGQTVSSNTVLIQMTRGADATLDGVVDAQDVTILGSHFNKPNSGQWVFGDFDYSGTCDATDVTTLGSTFGKTTPTLSPAQMTAEFGAAFTSAFEGGQAGAVPEPASLTLLGLGGLGLMARRSRKRRAQ